MNLNGGDDKAPPINGAEAERSFPVLAPPVVLLPVPGQCDVGYPCTICETDCRVLCFQTEVPDGLTLRHRLRFVTDEQMLKIAAAIHTY